MTTIPATICLQAPSVSMTPAQQAIQTFFSALAAEASISGIFFTISHLLRGENPNFWKTAILMTVFNVCCIGNSFIFVWNLFPQADTCTLADRLMNFGYHAFCLAFDAFVLFKTYHTCKSPRTEVWLACAIALLLLNRFIWLVLDVVLTIAVWKSDDRGNGLCFWEQNDVTGVGYPVADILVDSFATFVCLYVHRRAVFQAESGIKLMKALATENILRSALMLSANLFTVWVNNSPNYNVFWAGLTDPLQSYVASRIVNAELLWVEVRKNSHMSTSVTRTMVECQSC